MYENRLMLSSTSLRAARRNERFAPRFSHYTMVLPVLFLLGGWLFFQSVFTNHGSLVVLFSRLPWFVNTLWRNIRPPRRNKTGKTMV